MTIAKILQSATAELKESNDRAEQIEHNRKVEAEILRRRLQRYEPSDDDWYRAYLDQKNLESCFGEY